MLKQIPFCPFSNEIFDKSYVLWKINIISVVNRHSVQDLWSCVESLFYILFSFVVKPYH